MACVVRGLVQGVGYRWFVQRHAREQNLTGWVRNNVDGSVELVAQGQREKLDTLLVVLKKGPRSAMVRDVILEWRTPTTVYHSFEIR